MGTDGACGLLFCAAKRSGTFPPNMPAGLRARVSTDLLKEEESPQTSAHWQLFVARRLCLF